MPAITVDDTLVLPRIPRPDPAARWRHRFYQSFRSS
jgi:hypothetical protein